VNINMLRDQDNDPGFYVAASSTDPKWPGAVLFSSSDSGASYQQIATLTAAATMGRLVGTLGDFAGGNIPDELNAITVRLSRGSLSSISYASFLAGAQTALIGDEIVYFRNAALNVDGTYTVSGFLRGQRGSEYAISRHGPLERFILLNTATVQRIPGVTADLHVPRLYKAVTVGSTLAKATAQSFTNDGAGLKPYAPVHVGGGRNAAGDVLINWTRRGRISGEWRNFADVPLGEDSEQYNVEIWDAAYATLKRTLGAVSSPTATYAAADETADFGSPQSALYLKVYQLSSIVGRGYPALAVVALDGTVASDTGSAGAGGSGGGGSTGGGSTGGTGGTGSTGGTGGTGGTVTGTTVSYVESTVDFPNPERGFARQVGNCQNIQFNSSSVASVRTGSAAITVHWMLVYLNSFISSAISSTVLSNIQTNFDNLRAGGAKAWLRFEYDQTNVGNDANKTQMKAHIDQLRTLLQNNADVIVAMDAGFIGSYGEWSQSGNYGFEGSFTTQNWADRKEVLEYLLDALPSNRMIMLRVPGYKQHFYGTTALNPTTAFTGTYAARLGHHNDAFLSGADDQGTYGLTQTVAFDRAFVAEESKYTPHAGESDNYSTSNLAKTACPAALSDLAYHHWSFINDGFEANVLQQWKDGGCYSSISKKLGYRFVLVEGTYPATGARGATIALSMTINNVGFASPFNQRHAKLVLRNTSTSAETAITLSADPRTWLPGAQTVTETVTLPSGMAAGSYALFLALPDMASSLAANPAYAIQFANVGVWESTTGYNDLSHTIVIS
jgi:uncharacterized membrane protein YgcG